MTRLSSPATSPSPMRRRPRSWAKKCERACCSVAQYFPLAFVYSLTTWAIWVEAGIAFLPNHNGWRSESSSSVFLTSLLILTRIVDYTSSLIGIILYVLLNWAYTTAVFTDAGSPLASKDSSGYSSLPTHESSHKDAAYCTVKSTGNPRYCKKCKARKPDRAHHCSTCGRCVLKMDHHCPWLAACVGLRNYKPFLLFLIYVTIYCWLCFVVTATWLWSEVFSDSQNTDSLLPINCVLLCVISGVIGLVLTGFTGWHLSLAYRGQTTIECLEKTRYLAPARKAMRAQTYRGKNGEGGQSYGQQLAEIHANALPGVTRSEEGEAMLADDDLEQGSRAQRSLRRDYNEIERSRERERYENYLDEKDSEKLPHAFDLGWRRNLHLLFGPRPLLWFFPICNTSGDGWHWEHSPEWVTEREAIKHERERQWLEDRGTHGYTERPPKLNGHTRRWPTRDDSERHFLTTSNGVMDVPISGYRSPGKADHILGRTDEYFDRDHDDGSPSSRMSMKTLRRRGSFDDSSDGEDDGYELSSDDERRLSQDFPYIPTSKNEDAGRKRD